MNPNTQTLHTLGQSLWIDNITREMLSDGTLDRYIADHGEASLSSVGCYHLEGAGAQLFEKIEGDYFAILGLPLFGLLGFLREKGVISS